MATTALILHLQRTVGTPTAGLSSATSGERLVLGLDPPTFLFAVPLVLGLPEPGPEPGLPKPGSQPGAGAGPARRFLGDVRQGLSLIVRTPSLLAIATGS